MTTGPVPSNLLPLSPSNSGAPSGGSDDLTSRHQLNWFSPGHFGMLNQQPGARLLRRRQPVAAEVPSITLISPRKPANARRIS